MSLALQVREDDLAGSEIAALLRLHLDHLNGLFPSESVHAMPIERLRQGDVTFFSAWHGEKLAGCGALKRLDPQHGEIKSMRTHPDYPRMGVGKAVLRHLLDEARARGYTRVSLETGTIDALLPARRLYETQGFTPCAPFADYREDPFSICMTINL